MTDTDELRAREIVQEVFSAGWLTDEPRKIFERAQGTVQDALATARAEERERCARIAEAGGRKLIATAIRTAGDAP